MYELKQLHPTVMLYCYKEFSNQMSCLLCRTKMFIFCICFLLKWAQMMRNTNSLKCLETFDWYSVRSELKMLHKSRIDLTKRVPRMKVKVELMTHIWFYLTLLHYWSWYSGRILIKYLGNIFCHSLESVHPLGYNTTTHRTGVTSRNY